MNIARHLIVLIFASSSILAANTAKEIPLWPEGAPGSEGKTASEKEDANHNVSSVHHPSITPFLPAPGKGNGAAVLVIPGGGHSKLCLGHEGNDISQWFADHGVAAFMLKHRLAREEGSTYKIEVESLADTQRAMRLIRSRAAEWHIDPARLGAMGFSAGGELVALAWMRPSAGRAEATDAIDRLDARPAFQVLIYPGRSGDIMPTKDTPPAFLACGENDRKDIAEGLAEVYLRFKRAGISVEFHVYAGVGHGFGYRPGMKGPVAAWPDRVVEWLDAKGFLVPGK